MESTSLPGPSCMGSKPDVRAQEERPEKRVTFEFPIHHHRTRLDDIPEASEPEKKVAFHLPIRPHHIPTRLDDIPEACEPVSGSECPSWDVMEEYQHEATVEPDQVDTESITPKIEPNLKEFYTDIIRGEVESVKKQLDFGARIERETDDGFSPLVLAIMEEQLDVFKLLLERGADVHHRSKRLPTLVHAAMREEHGPEMMQLLLDHGAILNTISGPDWKTALHWAAAEGKAKSVEFLISKGMDIEAKCSKGRTPLILAADAGHEQVVKVLWAHGADLRAKSENGGSALTWAACRDRIGVVQFLLDQGVDVNFRDNNGHTALSLASHFGHLAIVEKLLSHGADINTLTNKPKHCTSLMAAACWDRIDVLKCLIDNGADLSIQSYTGENALEIAMIERRKEAVGVLMEAMSDEDYPKESVALQIAMGSSHAMVMSLMATASIMYSYMEITLGEPDKYAWLDWVLKQGGDLVKPMALWKMLHAALDERDLPLLKALIDQGCDVNRRLESGHSPLSFAVGNNCGTPLELIQMLLDAGADPNLRIQALDGMNYTPFDHAVIDLDFNETDSEKSIKTEVVDLLLQSGHCKINRGKDPESTAFSFVLSKSKEWGADVADALAIRMIDSITNVNEDRDDIGCTLLHVAVLHGREDFVDLLLSRGADLEAVAGTGFTPLIFACQYKPKMVPVLLDRGANMYAKYGNNAGALHAAASNGSVQSLEVLLERGMDIEEQSSGGYPPLACALMRGQEQAALYLLKKGASAKWLTIEKQQTALHFAARHGLEDALQELLKQDVCVDAVDSKGWTPLHEAVASGTPTTVSLLLDAGADIERPLSNGDRPLIIALVNENEAIALLLIDRGADIMATGAKHRTALHEAADYNLPRVAEKLLQQAKSLHSAVDDETWTPLCVCGHVEIAEMLIHHGADVNYADKDGWTPLHQAVLNGDIEVSRSLVECGADLHARTTDDGLTVMERAQDMWDWNDRPKDKSVAPRLLVKARVQVERFFEEAAMKAGREATEKLNRELKHRRAMRELEERVRKEEQEKRKREEELEGLGGKFELIEKEEQEREESRSAFVI